CAFAGKPEPRKARQVEYACRVTNGVALLAYAFLPGAFPAESLGGFLRYIVAGLCIPVGALPTICHAELCAQRLDAVVDWRKLAVPPRRPGMAREVNGVFMPVHLHALGDCIVGLGGKGRETAGIAAPHVPLGAALGHPLCQYLAGTACLCDAEGEDAGFKSVWQARHRPDERIAVGRIGNRAVDDLGQAGSAEDRNAGDRVVEIPFQTLQIVREKLE